MHASQNNPDILQMLVAHTGSVINPFIFENCIEDQDFLKAIAVTLGKGLMEKDGNAKKISSFFEKVYQNGFNGLYDSDVQSKFRNNFAKILPEKSSEQLNQDPTLMEDCLKSIFIMVNTQQFVTKFNLSEDHILQDDEQKNASNRDLEEKEKNAKANYPGIFQAIQELDKLADDLNIQARKMPMCLEKYQMTTDAITISTCAGLIQQSMVDYIKIQNPTSEDKDDVYRTFIQAKNSLDKLSAYQEPLIAIMKNILFVLTTAGLGLFYFVGKAIHAAYTENEMKTRHVFFGAENKGQQLVNNIEHQFEKIQTSKKANA